MNEPNKNPRPILGFVFKVGLICLFVGFVAYIIMPNNIGSRKSSPAWNANMCINNLREIDAAKNEWALENNAKSNGIITINDIRPYIERERYNPYIKLDAKGNLPKCPSGGIYTIGKIGEPPICSLGTNALPAHVLQ
jgi:hypothetical protein